MRGVGAVLRKELSRRSQVFLVGGVAGVLALLGPWVPPLRGETANDARLLVATALAVAMMAGTALVHGATSVAGELRGRCLSFLFSRPLSGTAIWAGKSLAGLVLSLGGGVLAMAPVSFLAPGGLAWVRWEVAVWAIAGVVAVGTAAQLVGVALVSRSWLLVLDAVALAGAVGATLAVAASLWASEAPVVVAVAAVTGAAATLVVLLVASWAQVAHGRCSASRAHGAQSLVLWAGVACILVPLAGYTLFLRSATPASLRTVTTLQPGPDQWVVVAGVTRGRGDYRPAFLLDVASGQFLRLLPSEHSVLDLVFSGDGRRVAWLAPAGSSRQTWQVRLALLDIQPPEVRETPLVFSAKELPRRLCFSPDGSFLVFVEGRDAVAYRLEDWREVGRVRLYTPATARLAFSGPETIRVEQWKPGGGEEDGELTIARWELSSGRFTETGRVAADPTSFHLSILDLATNRMIVGWRTVGERELRLCDATTGEIRAVLGRWPANRVAGVLFLADGRLVLEARGKEGARLRVFDPAGHQLAELPAGERERVIPCGELVRGVVLIKTVDSRVGEGDPLDSPSGFLLELETGILRPLPAGRVPAVCGILWRWGGDRPRVNNLGARLLLTPLGAIEVLDPATGATRPLLGTDGQL